MDKIDFKKKLKHLYSASAKKVAVVHVPAMNFLSVEGKGDPNTSADFTKAMETLYAVSYTLKFMLKGGKNPDYVVPPLEGLWWTPSNVKFSRDNTDAWCWKLMIMQPDFASSDLVEKAKNAAQAKKSAIDVALLDFNTFSEGKSAQLLHIGPYDQEEPTIAMLEEYITGNGFTQNGRHHEIYLSDPRKTAPEKLKTIIRHPIK